MINLYVKILKKIIIEISKNNKIKWVLINNLANKVINLQYVVIW